MKPSKWRLAGAALGAMVSLLTLDAYERHRATHAPSGWEQEDDNRLPVLPRAWRIGSSAWRVAPGSHWKSEDNHLQTYARAKLLPGARFGLSLSSHESKRVWIWIAADGSVTTEVNGETVSCMGNIAADPEIQAIELKGEPEGLMVTRGDLKMICPKDNEELQPVELKVENGPIEIRSIGRDRLSDGIPLSPLWWMSGLMALGFVWMLLLDLTMGLTRRLFRLIRPPKAPPAAPTEE